MEISINELAVLSNLEMINAEMIKHSTSKEIDAMSYEFTKKIMR